MIIGGPGAGKSWLASRLGAALDLPVRAVDKVLYEPSGELRPAERIDKTVRDWTFGDRWIIDGGNTRTYADRIARVHWVIRLDPPRWLRLWRVIRRADRSLRRCYWAVRYDDVFGPKDHAATTSIDRRTTVLKVLRTRAEVTRLLAGTGHGRVDKA